MNENENIEQENQQEEQQPVEDKGLMSQPHEDTKEVSDDGMSTGKQEEVLDGEDLENLEFTRPDTFPEKRISLSSVFRVKFPLLSKTCNP